jgi:hypothetical protein
VLLSATPLTLMAIPLRIVLDDSIASNPLI